MQHYNRHGTIKEERNDSSISLGACQSKVERIAGSQVSNSYVSCKVDDGELYICPPSHYFCSMRIGTFASALYPVIPPNQVARMSMSKLIKVNKQYTRS